MVTGKSATTARMGSTVKTYSVDDWQSMPHRGGSCGRSIDLELQMAV